MTTPTVLSVGKDLTLTSTRKSLLLAAGYHVKEAFSIDKAISVALSRAIDVTIICHTFALDESGVIISKVREKKRSPADYLPAVISVTDNCAE